MKARISPLTLVVATAFVVAALVSRPSLDQKPESAVAQQPSAKTSIGAPAPSLGPGAGAIQLDPASPPQEPSEDQCAFWQTTIDRMGLSVEQWAAASTAVLHGTVEDIGEAQWNTRDGKPPIGEKPIAYSDLLRLIRIAPAESLKGQLSSDVLWIPGGTIGCVTFIAEGFDLEVGGEYVFFLRDLEPLSGLTGIPRARLVWPIQKDGTVATQIDGSLSIDTFRERVSTP